jgi:hypothetical protein
MIRKVLTGVAALALMTGAAFADTYTYRDENGQLVTVHQPDPGKHAVRGGVAGAGAGALIGCLVTIPIGCAPGAAVGAAVGGGTGAVVGAASTPPARTYIHRDGRYYDYPED